MNTVVWNALAFIVTLSVLVAVHEFGHFWVARRVGVKVLTFSIGFGPALWKRRDKHDCEYVFAAIPLGGYVKMLDEREGDVPIALRERAFNRQTPGKRWLIAAAGPLFNFAFAIIAYTIMFMVGVSDMRPVLGPVPSGTVAEKIALKESDEIVAVDGVMTPGWEAFGNELVAHLGNHQALRLTVKDTHGERHVWLPAGSLNLGDKPETFLRDIGITPTRLPAVIGVVSAGGAADRAGLRAGDKIIGFNDELISAANELREKLAANAGKTVKLDLLRSGQIVSISLMPDSRVDAKGKTSGFIGIGFNSDQYVVRVQYDPVSALYFAVIETGKTIKNIVNGIGQLLTGNIPLKAISGPLAIAENAGASASIGLDWFMKFLGLLSVNLGLINLLPIPMLDGGHLMFYSIEALRGKPLSERWQEIGMRIGISMVATLMMVALYNDLTRYF